MKILSFDEGLAKLRIEVPEDLWHLEKVIRPGDGIGGSSYRKFTTDSGKSERKPVNIIIRAEKAEFHKSIQKLRVLGVIIGGGPEDLIKIGAHHSLDFDVNDVISIKKFQWRDYEWQRIKEAEKSARQTKICVLIMDDSEVELFAIKEYGIESLFREVISGCGKYMDESKDAKAKFYTGIYDFLKSANVEKLIIAGPGFEKENFVKFLKSKDDKLLKNAVVESTGNTGKQGVFELINKDVISSVSQELRFNDEVKAIEEVVSRINSDYVTYGIKEVNEALDYGAVDKLLVLDSLLFEDRRVQALLDKAEKIRSKVMIISHENEASDKLKGLSGVAAILRFKIG